MVDATGCRSRSVGNRMLPGRSLPGRTVTGRTATGRSVAGRRVGAPQLLSTHRQICPMSSPPLSPSVAGVDPTDARGPAPRAPHAPDANRAAAPAAVPVPVAVAHGATRLALAGSDAAGVLFVIGLVLALTDGAPAAPGFGSPFTVAATVATVLGLYAVHGLYSQIVLHPALEMRRLGTVTAVMGLAGGIAGFAVTGAPAAGGWMAAAGILGAVIVPSCRVLGRIVLAPLPWWGLPAVVVGDGPQASSLVDTLRRWPEIGLYPVAVLRPNSADVPAGDGGVGAASARRCSNAALDLSRRLGIPYVLLTDTDASRMQQTNRLRHYSRFFDHVVVAADACAGAAAWTTERCGAGLFGYGVRSYALQPIGQGVKRLLDVAGSVLALLLIAPLFAVIAALIRLDSRGSVFYRQQRLGREGRIFTVLKFRTMYVDADAKLEEILQTDPAKRAEYQQYHKLQNDPRVTRIGRILRRFSLDELPQLLNVLRGDMSLVGPRAYMPGELEKMKGVSRAVLETPPGITGLWQVSGRNTLSFATRVDLDVHYVQNWTLWLDLYLLLRTIPVVLSGEGAS